MAKNTTTRSTARFSRNATVPTQKARLVEFGWDEAEVASMTPKERKAAYLALLDGKAPVVVPDADPTDAEDPQDRPTSKPTPRNCGCGCGHPTVTAKARFLSGHDARFAGRVGRGDLTPADWQVALITPALQAKIDSIRQTQAKRDAAKAARKAAQEAAKAAYAAALAEAR